MVTDTIADLLTRIRNALLAGHLTVTIPASRKKEQILKVLLEEGYIANFEVSGEDSKKREFQVSLRYSSTGESVLKVLRRLSKPGRRVYVKKDDIPQFRGGLGTVIVSTSRGVLTDREARKQGIGGELICAVF